jgi:hypothetical protein
LAAFEVAPLHDRLVNILKTSAKLFADETRCPVLDPGRGKTKTGYLRAIARMTDHGVAPIRRLSPTPMRLAAAPST